MNYLSTLPEPKPRRDMSGYMGKKWTQKDDDYLRANVGYVSYTHISAALGRGKNSIYARIEKLSLTHLMARKMPKGLEHLTAMPDAMIESAWYGGTTFTIPVSDHPGIVSIRVHNSCFRGAGDDDE